MLKLLHQYQVKFLVVINIFLIFIIDQFTKSYILANYVYHASYPLINVVTAKLNFGLNFFLAYNKGTAFSIVRQATDSTRLLLIAITIGITLGLVYWFVKTSSREKVTLFALSLILGGAIGNIYDRVMLGYVIDFIDVYVGSYHWPVFNFADCAISIGAMILCWRLVARD